MSCYQKAKLVRKLKFLAFFASNILHNLQLSFTFCKWKKQLRSDKITDQNLEIWLHDNYEMYLDKDPKLAYWILKYLSNQTQNLWLTLASEGKYELITKLHRAQNKEEGYSTIIIPTEGFSKNDTTHNQVLKWLKKNKIKTFDPNSLSIYMENSLKSIR